MGVAARAEAPIRRFMRCCAPLPYRRTVCGRALNLKQRLGVGEDGATPAVLQGHVLAFVFL